VGGTSVGTPQWAALLAIVDQRRQASGLASLDGPQVKALIQSGDITKPALRIPNTVTFPPTPVNNDGTITLPSSQVLFNGESVIFTSSGTPINYQVQGNVYNNLTQGNVYYIKIVPNVPNTIKLTASLADALNSNSMGLILGNTGATGTQQLKFVSAFNVVIPQLAVTANGLINVTGGQGSPNANVLIRDLAVLNPTVGVTYPSVSFNPSLDVNINSHGDYTIDAPARGFATGEAVRLGGVPNGTPIGGLIFGAVYYVIFENNNTLELADSLPNALHGIPLPLPAPINALANPNTQTLTPVPLDLQPNPFAPPLLLPAWQPPLLH